MTDYQENSLLDCSGMNCPLPILKTKKAIDGMNSGEILKMISTDPGSINDVNAFTKRTGHELIESIAEDGDYTFFIRKS
ncbi:MAG TPA: sulfurtransferase TusA family protein [Candidatus Marinimicrobia bacterium]|jgi:tRNA 2-thiouridine synthesizing protein A|nr:sulfurtransferase TusA family protein [Candidatus Neomarinimicrobiota bacterium]MDP7122448.1 sulfurtransferase TusA family protein [Candidatus Neomarinimicrobiota bacterium]MDP7436371.1 sulfurtransferase TusA family protein [Candidatus Neomarinimicrobiota bacterium]MDP7528659.1 sulfurtransferase TusA family protein [Candidatus Neomarinimicrobiota bacterium]MDP7715654.1 sulfurtransferase TusA family protein [Candidatus Neomarinimicrobiota bacterium]|tara:strand:- start:3432 stop:3668 length:237 start_codon:yes stop_codon:yes gene_type:complete